MTKSNEYSYSREPLSRFWIAICLLAMAPRQCRKFHRFSKCRAIFKLMELCKKKKKKILIISILLQGKLLVQ